MAAQRQAQLIVATHSEMIVNNADARELYMMYGTPRLVSDMPDSQERHRLMESLGVLTHSDLLEADGALGVLYTEDFTDIDILLAFAGVLKDESSVRLLSTQLLTKSSKAPLPDGLGEVTTQRHWEMLKLIRADFPALELLDGDAKNKADDLLTGTAEKMQRLRWRRYEIESYLIHPTALQRFVGKRLGRGFAAAEASSALVDALTTELQAEFVSDPDHPVRLAQRYLLNEPVSKTLLPSLLQAAGLNVVQKREFFEIALAFLPEEVHPEIGERLNQIKQAFGVPNV